ncbi:MAG: hypothetical protein GX424_07160 [Clostridiales bacterium]|jgi:hypothetical protein|nr:hypothetical protein [Clostridiales bacterium]
MKKRIIAAVFCLAFLSAWMVGCQKAGTAQQNRSADSRNVVAAAAGPNIGRAEAVNTVKNMINVDYGKYRIKLVRDDLEYDGQRYYEFQLLNDCKQFGPSLIVSRDNGVIYCYYPNHTVAQVYDDQVFRSKC